MARPDRANTFPHRMPSQRWLARAQQDHARDLCAGAPESVVIGANLDEYGQEMEDAEYDLEEMDVESNDIDPIPLDILRPGARIWASNMIACENCGHKWIAVAKASMVGGFECSRCGQKTGELSDEEEE